MKVSIIIAVYDEAATAGELLERVWVQPVLDMTKEIVIVESNSTDGSREIVARFAARHAEQSSAVRVIYQEAPRGKGHAIRQGLTAATGDIVLIQDADLEYDVADYPALLRPIVESRAAFVLGSRHMGSTRWGIRRFAHENVQALFMNIGGLIFHSFFNLLFSTQLTDPTSMYKVFRADCLRGSTFTCDRFDFDFELLATLIRAGYPPLEVPVSYTSRGFHEGKKIRIFRDPLTWIVAIIRCRFAAVRYNEKPAPSASS